MIVFNHTSKRSMKNSVTFISASIFSCDNEAQKRQKFILFVVFRVFSFSDDAELGIKCR